MDVVQYPGFKTNIGMRGFAPSAHGITYTLVLRNGIPVGTDNLATLGLENVEQVEILKGPYSSFFGSGAMGGVINIQDKRTSGKISGGASVAYGSFNTYKVKANIGGKINSLLNFDFYAGTRARNDNYKTGNNNLLNLFDDEKLIMEDKSYGEEYKDSKYKQYTVGGRLGLQIKNSWGIHLNQNYWTAKDVQTHGNFWGSYSPQGKDIDRWSQSLSVEGLAGNHELRFTPHYSMEKETYQSDLTDESFKNTENNLKTYGFVLQDAIKLGNHRIIVGVDNFTKKYESKMWASDFTTGIVGPAAPHQPDYSNMSLGAYFQANINLLDDNLNATIGGRFDNITFKLFETDLLDNEDATESYSVFNPNLGIQYKLPAGFKVHAAVGRAFVAPDAFKMAGQYDGWYTYRGNSDLDPETSVTFDFGLGYANRELGLEADVTYFTTDFKDIIVTDYSNADYVTYMNADKAKLNGLEVMFNYDFGALSNYAYSLKLYLDYTHMYDAELTIEGPTVSVKEQMKYVRMNKASFGVIFENQKGIFARINARYIGERREDNWLYQTDWVTYERMPYQTEDGQDIRPELINEDVLNHPDYLILDLSASYTIKEKYTIGITIDNLLDDNYMEKDAYYMPGRSIMGSFSIKF